MTEFENILPPVPRLKDQAARLRARAIARGEEMSAAGALEALAQIMGFRDWNTLRAMAVRAPADAPVQPERKVLARYMGSAPIRARVMRVEPGAQDGLWRVWLRFDESRAGKGLPAVLESRVRVHADVDAAGVSVGRRSDGVPHLRIELG